MTEAVVFRGPEGSITLTPAAVTDLVASAARSVDGVRVRRPRRAVEVRHADGRASVSLELVALHGESLAELAREVQQRVGRSLAAVSGLEVERVDVEIAELG
ncbi:MAG TPA: Asp23/Gls24 family envelope stress response protein [Gaiellaceae bacterium]|nr:Asp23/Gls24 family envelope stress response protein [Gaiellaceae bacterium]